MVLKLYGSPEASGATQTVLIALLETHIPFELCALDLAGSAYQSPTYQAIQPFKQFPAIDDEGFILYESRAICRYLEHKHPDQGTRLEPPRDDVRARSIYEQALAVEAFNFHPHAHRVYLETMAKKRRGLDTDERVVRKALKKLSETLDVYNDVLAKTRYLAGDEFTLADLFHIAFGGTVIRAGHDIMTCGSRPNVVRWWHDIQSRSSVRRFPEAGLFTGVVSYHL